MPIDQIAKHYEQETAAPFIDNLTGLYQHGFFLESLDREVHRYNRHGQVFSLCLVDLDDFRLLNNRIGPLKCDRLLKAAGHGIRSALRQADLPARFSGDRFAVLLVETSADQAIAVGNRIREELKKRSEGKLTASVGVTTCNRQSAVTKDRIIEEAEAALRQAKDHGKDRVVGFTQRPSSDNVGAANILLVDDEPLNLKLLKTLLDPYGYQLFCAENGEKALKLLNRHDMDLVLLDIMMPGISGFEICQQIKSRENTRNIPVVLVTALDDSEVKIKGIEAGADDFISKPPNTVELLARVKSLLKMKKLNNNLARIENVLFSMARMVEAKDVYTQGHVDRVSALALAIGRKMELPENDCDALLYGGAFHDIGKIGIPEAILNKPGPLTDAEWDIMKTHPEIGYNICLPLKQNLGAALDIVRHHHEKLDGTGYPDGLEGKDISMVARIMAVADIYDALTTDRPYRKGMARDQSLAILFEEAENGKLDREIVKCLAGIVGVSDSSPMMIVPKRAVG